MRTPSIQTDNVSVNLVRKLGLAGFLFFLGKGLLWLGIPALAGLLL